MELIVNNNLFNVKCVMTSKDIQKGMMGKKFDKTFDGMLFIMKESNHSFWMKNCIIPLDILIIKNNVIVNIHSNCPPCHDEFDCPSYCGNGNIVLEIEGGSCEELNILPGDSVEYDLY